MPLWSKNLDSRKIAPIECGIPSEQGEASDSGVSADVEIGERGIPQASRG
jgi:hypothetical protein